MVSRLVSINPAQTRVIWKEGTSVQKILSPEWPVVHFFKLIIDVGKPNPLGDAIAGLVVLGAIKTQAVAMKW